MPNYLGDEFHDVQDNIRIDRHLEHPGDAVRIQHEISLGVLIEWDGRAIEWADHSMITGVVVGVVSAKPAEISPRGELSLKPPP